MSTPASKPILVCYDGSDGARRAVAQAAALFPGREAVVLQVWSPVALIAAAYGGMLTMPVYDDEALRDGASKIAAEGAARAGSAGLDATAEIAEATYQGTWHTILDVADRHDAAVIVLGARGLSSFKSLVLGSVSHGVAQHAHRAVMIVPPAADHTAVAESTERASATA